jgi:hypothetical protein
MQSSVRKRLGEFRIVQDHTKRKNPKSLRKVLYDIVLHNFDGDLHIAATQLQQSISKNKLRNFGINITSETIYDIIQDRSHIKYAHLDAFAQYLNIPVGIILIYSRFLSHEDENRNDLNLEFNNGLDLFIEFLFDKSQRNERFKGNVASDISLISSMFNLGQKQQAFLQFNLEQRLRRRRRTKAT